LKKDPLRPKNLAKKVPKQIKSLFVIGVSTGGPKALSQSYSTLTGKLAIPIFIVQTYGLKGFTLSFR